MRPVLCIVMPVLVMEDTAISRQLKRHGRPACLRDRVTTLARRWERHGVWPHHLPHVAPAGGLLLRRGRA